MEALGRKLYNRRRYEDIKRPGNWTNKAFFKTGNDIELIFEKTESGSLIKVRQFVLFFFREILYYLEEREYRSIRNKDGWQNSVLVTIQSNLRKLLLITSLMFYKVFVHICKNTSWEVQEDLVKDTQSNLHTFSGVHSEKVNELADVVIFLIYCPKVKFEFFVGNWKNGYEINIDFVQKVKKEIGTIDWSKTLYNKEKLAVKGILVNYCRLRIGKIYQTDDGSDGFKIEQYLKNLAPVEEARLVARLIDDAVTHSRYQEYSICLFDRERSWRTVVTIDKRYRDMVSIFSKHNLQNYHRVYCLEELDEIFNAIEKGTSKEDMADGGIKFEYGEIFGDGRTLQLFDYTGKNEKKNALIDKEVIEKSGIKKLKTYQITTKCFYKYENIYVSIGFGYGMSRYGHETSISLEKKIGLDVSVGPHVIQTRRHGILPYIFYGISICLLILTYVNIDFQSFSLNSLDQIGIVFAIWSALVWFFNNFTNTVGGIRDLMMFKSKFTKVSQVRRHFNLTRREACISFYWAKFLTSLIGKGYKCYFNHSYANGPLEMDEIARFEEVIGRRSLAMKNQLLYHTENDLIQVRMTVNHGIYHIVYPGIRSEWRTYTSVMNPILIVLASAIEQHSEEKDFKRIEQVGFGESKSIETILDERGVLFDSVSGTDEVIRTDFLIG